MEYVRIDENLPDSKKMLCIARDSRDACLGLYVRALCYCARHETDGVFPAGLVDDNEVCVSMLVDVGLFDAIDAASFGVHDYLDYNKSGEEIEAIREARRAAGSRGGKQTASKRLANSKQTPSKTKQTPSKSVPIDIDIDKDIKVKTLGGFEAFWSAYPRKVGKEAAKKAWVKAIKSADPDLITAKVASFPFDLREELRFVPHASTWLNGKRWEDETIPFLPSPDDDEPEWGERCK